ncbi:hypothetical protein SAMN05444745_1505 [Arthrobacter sp. OV608]|nr:hypothetical protein SAMN05444745_1505 [Arthrobacter sp. OV608]
MKKTALAYKQRTGPAYPELDELVELTGCHRYYARRAPRPTPEGGQTQPGPTPVAGFVRWLAEWCGSSLSESGSRSVAIIIGMHFPDSQRDAVFAKCDCCSRSGLPWRSLWADGPVSNNCLSNGRALSQFAFINRSLKRSSQVSSLAIRCCRKRITSPCISSREPTSRAASCHVEGTWTAVIRMTSRRRRAGRQQCGHSPRPHYRKSADGVGLVDDHEPPPVLLQPGEQLAQPRLIRRPFWRLNRPERSLHFHQAPS